MAISMTEAAAQHIRRSLNGRGKGEGIRLGVRTTGCSGLAYVLEFVDEVVAEDQVFESHGEKVIIDPKSLTYLDGTELDFVKEGLNEGFKFNNPTYAVSVAAAKASTSEAIRGYSLSFRFIRVAAEFSPGSRSACHALPRTGAWSASGSLR